MTWSKPHVSWNKEHEALIDRCINCGQTKEVEIKPNSIINDDLRDEERVSGI